MSGTHCQNGYVFLAQVIAMQSCCMFLRFSYSRFRSFRTAASASCLLQWPLRRLRWQVFRKPAWWGPRMPTTTVCKLRPTSTCCLGIRWRAGRGHLAGEAGGDDMCHGGFVNVQHDLDQKAGVAWTKRPEETGAVGGSAAVMTASQDMATTPRSRTWSRQVSGNGPGCWRCR